MPRVSPGRKPLATTNSWPTSLFGLASLLLTFFVALTAVSVREQARAGAALDSFAHRGAAAAVPISVVPLGGDMPAVRSIERQWGELFAIGAASTPFGEG